jgi:hypothetical protein
VSAALPPQLLSDLLARPQDVAEVVMDGVRVGRAGLGRFPWGISNAIALAHDEPERISEVLIRSTWLAANGKPLEARWVRLPDHRCADLGGGQWFGCEGAP